MSDFQWKCEPEAEKLIENWLIKALALSPFITHLEKELLKLTSTRLFDWVDHIRVSPKSLTAQDLKKAGFIIDVSHPSYSLWRQPQAKLPQVALNESGDLPEGIALGVESIADFLMVRGMKREIFGSLFSPYRSSLVSTENQVCFWVVERRGAVGIDTLSLALEDATSYLLSKEKWQTRQRSLDHETEDMTAAHSLAEEFVRLLGRDRAAWLVLECERSYWQARNLAGQIQKNRQDHLGMGWANHDHHTFRSSRKHFASLVQLFEKLGFYCRERYYAGKEAGWGAQIMENEKAKLVLFLDVDLAPDEINIDFAHEKLGDLSQHGTVGLWCALHGDSILKGGMHHLEAQFMFEDLTKDLKHYGVGMMDPFSSFPYLKQAFTAGEIWHVDPQRISKLLKENKITPEQAEKFSAYGAVGSHMENLQRREGYKGFNKKNVSVIIKKTDPRILDKVQ